MFFQFAAWNSNAVPVAVPVRQWIVDLTAVHPRVLLEALEQYFSTRALGAPNYATPPPLRPPDYGAVNLFNLIAAEPADSRWEHIAYAYMIENTRIFEIFDRVVREYEKGERFETPDPDTALWLRSTEELFYRDLPLGYAGALTSQLRPDLRAIRRNAYYRLLGLDLNHGFDGNRQYQYDKPVAANRDFVRTFEEFLREVWRGMVNSANIAGPNDTDRQRITDHARQIREMLRVRRLNNNLLREEFWAVVIMSWFHLVLMWNTPVVSALKAEAESPAVRLQKIGERVGIAAHNRADDLFNMAFELSAVLRYIEDDPLATNPAFVGAYYLPGPLATQLRTIIDHWSGATGRDIKATRVAPVPGTPAPNGRAQVSSNGRSLTGARA